jgi:uncharacterized membrane protein
MLTTALALPSGVSFPPFPYLFLLLLAAVAVLSLLYRTRAPVGPRIVFALGPWVVAGSMLFTLFLVGYLPDPIAPLFGIPAVFLTTFVIGGLVWAAAGRFTGQGWSASDAATLIFLLGILVAAAVSGFAYSVGRVRGTLSPFWTAVTLGLSLLVAIALLTGLYRFVPHVRNTGLSGVVVVFGHSLDAMSTAIGVDVLGFVEQVPPSVLLIEYCACLPTASILGTTWLYLFVKLGVVLVVVVLSKYVASSPRRGHLALGVVASIGLGPGAHNLVLFNVA